jgi:hypothetical protein
MWLVDTAAVPLSLNNRIAATTIRSFVPIQTP